MSAEQLLAAAERISRGPADLEVSVLRHDTLRRDALDSSILDPSERERAKGSYSYLVSHLLLRELLARRIGCAAQEVHFHRDPCPLCGQPHGRPATSGAVEFSLSRSGSLTVVALAGEPVGVDVQITASRPQTHAVAPMLHPVEQAEIAQAPERFTAMWVRKEAYLKGIGCGIAGDLAADYLGFSPAPPGPAGWTIIDLEVDPGYCSAVAVRAC